MLEMLQGGGRGIVVESTALGPDKLLHHLDRWIEIERDIPLMSWIKKTSPDPVKFEPDPDPGHRTYSGHLTPYENKKECF